MKRPRKLKKAVNNAVFSYDVASRPVGMDFPTIMKVFHDYGILLYDSEGGNSPDLFSRANKRVSIVDSRKAVQKV